VPAHVGAEHEDRDMKKEAIVGMREDRRHVNVTNPRRMRRFSHEGTDE
jgi:hypothetical protein